MNFDNPTPVVLKLAIAAILEKGFRATPATFVLALKNDRIGALLDLGDNSLFVVHGGKMVLTATVPEDDDGELRTYRPGRWEQSLFAIARHCLSEADRAQWARKKMN